MIKHEKTVPIEYLSGTAFLLMAIGLSVFSLRTPDTNHHIFWTSILTMFSVLQLMSVICRGELYFLRLVMAWVSGMIWMWISYSSLNSVIAMPVLCIAIANLYSFSKLGFEISDHIEFLAENKQNDSILPH